MKTIQSIYIKVTFGLLLVSSFTACEFGDTNINPASVTEDQADLNLLLPSAIVQLGFSEGALGGRNSGMFMQYLQGQDAQQLAITQYNMQDNVMNNFWRTGMYAGGMKDLNLIFKKTTAQEGEDAESVINAPYYRGIAKILMAEHLNILTTFFGDIPYSDAFKGEEGNITPIYDSQADIFATIERLIDEGIADLSGDEGDIVPSSDDVIFGGDADSWVAAAHGLKARYLMEEGKYPEASTELASAIGSNAGNALFPFEATVNGANPFWLFENDRTATLATHPYFRGVMSGDPRYDEYINGSNGFANVFWTSQSSPTKLITYSEIKFMEAEIAARNGNAAAAEAAMEVGIRANMEVIGIGGGAINNYLLELSGGDLATVMNEKYKVIYPLTYVAWSDQRRTGFPALTPNRSIKTDAPSIPQRFPYPSSEDQFNKANKDAARDRLGIATEDDNIYRPLPVFQ